MNRFRGIGGSVSRNRVQLVLELAEQEELHQGADQQAIHVSPWFQEVQIGTVARVSIEEIQASQFERLLVDQKDVSLSCGSGSG